MEEQMPQNIPPVPQDSLDQAPATMSSVEPVVAAPTPTQGGEILTGSETLDAPSQQMAAETPGGTFAQTKMTDVDPDDDPEVPHEGIFANRLFRKVFFASVALVGVVLLLALGGVGFQRFNRSDSAVGDSTAIARIGDQSVNITQQLPAQANTVALRNGVPTVLISGDLAVQGLIQVVGSQGTLTLDGTNVTGNQTITLPNASGEICLSSGNCAGAGAAATQSTTTTTVIVQETGGSGGVQSINGASGALSLQGTTDQVTVTEAGSTITLSLPQDISTTASPQFTSINLSTVGIQNGFNICDASNNCNFADANTAIIQGGNMFNSVVRVGARDNFGLELLTNNTKRISITNNGQITLGGTPQDRLVVTSQISGTVAMVFQGATDDVFATSLLVADPTAPRNIILPNADGTICLSSGNCSGGGGYGDVLNGGNNFNALMTLGTNDNYGLNLKTFNTNRITISNTGDIALLGTTAINANASFGQNSSSRLTFLGQLTGSAPLVFQGATDDTWATSLLVEDPTANRTILLPNADGTICLSSGNCAGPVGTGDVLQGGNNFNALMVLGTNDNFGFDFKTNNTTRLSITNTGNAAFTGDLTVQHNVVLGSTSTDRLTINGQIMGGTPFVFQGATDNTYATYFAVADPTANRSIILPNADGTICLSSGNCSTSGGAGDVLQGGNNFNATMILGTNDNFGLNFKTDNTERVTISNTGLVTVIQDFHVGGNTVLGSDATDTVIMQAGNLYVPNNLNVDTYTMYIDSAHDKVGFGEIPLGSARVGILATNGGDGLNVNNGTSAGNILTLQDNGTTVVTVGNEGATTFRNKTDSTSSFQIQNAVGSTLLSTDTTTRTVSVNGGPSTYTFTNTGVLFGTSTQYGQGGNSQTGIITADVDNNGSKDILTIGSGGLYVYSNNGNGTFSNLVAYGPNNQGVMAVGDINGDGWQDVVTAQDTYAFRLYQNNGNGTFAAGVLNTLPIPSGGGVKGAAVADLNGDGWQDVVSTAQFASWVSINNGDGTFATAYSIPSSTNFSTPQTADLNGDGWQDIVVNGSQVFMNNGNGTFATPVSYSSSSQYYVLSDFSGDGRADLALVGVDGFVRVRMNNGNGTFASAVMYPITGTNPRGIAAGDFNGDGRPDIAVTNYSDASLSILTNNGNGTFAAKVDVSTFAYPSGLAAGDFNGDGKADIVDTTDQPRLMNVYMSQGGVTTVRNSLSVMPVATADTGLYIKGLALQSADLLRVADSDDGVNLSVSGATGSTSLRNSSDNASAFQIQNAAGSTLMNVDTQANSISMFTTQSNSFGVWKSSNSALQGGRVRSVLNENRIYSVQCSGTVSLRTAVIDGGGNIGTWSTVGSSPATLQDCGVFAENGYLYIVGGYNSAAVYYATINPDGSLGSWQTANSLPANRAHIQPVVYNGRVYVVGGMLGSDANGTNTTYYATINPDGSLGSWQTGATLPYNSFLSGIVANNDRLYAVGGGSNRNTLIYATINPDGSLGSWQTNGATLPNANRAMGLMASNGSIYMFGGCTGAGLNWAIACGGSDTFFNAVYIATPQVDGSITGWQSVSTMPFALAGFGNPLLYDSRAYIIGGVATSSISSGTVIYAQIPTGTTTGGVTVTASSSTFTSNVIVQQASGANLLSTDISNGTLTVGGSVLAKNSTNNTTAFQIQNAAGDTLFNVDTTNKTVSLGAASATPTLFVMGNKNTSGDPTGTAGAMYYNSNTNRFRCYQNGAWADCIGNGSGSGDIKQDGNDLGGSTAMTIGTLNNGGFNVVTNSVATFSLSSTGAALFKNAADSTNAFQVQNTTGANLLNVDSTNNAVSLLANNSGETSAWQAGSTLPAARFSAAAVTANGYAYVIGGSTSSSFAGAANTSYYAKMNTNGTVGTWGTTTALPANRAGAGTAVANGYVYLVGGNDGSNYLSTTVYAKLNTDGTLGAWQTASQTFPGGVLRADASTIVANGYIYAIGGYDGTNTVATTFYAKLNADGTLGAWQTSANVFPSSAVRRQMGTAVANGYVYALGGTPASSPAASTYSAKLNTDGTIGAWATTTSLPETIRGMGTVVANGYIYAIGGEIGGGTQSDKVYYSRFDANGTLGSWTLAANKLLVSRFFNSAITANGYIYSLGGGNTTYYTSLPRVQVGGSLDLVGLQGQNMVDAGDLSQGSTGGSLTAGNGTFVGTLQVQGQAEFASNLGLAGDLSVGGQANFRNGINSTVALQIQNAAGGNLFSADTTNNLITIGGAASATPTLMVLSTKNTAGDPASTINGSMYYNSISGRFRCYQNGTWTDCIGSGLGTGDISQGGNNFGAVPVVIGSTVANSQLNFITNGVTRVSIGATEATMRIGSSASGAGKIILDDSGSLANEAEIYSDNTASLNFRAYASNSDINMMYGGAGVYGMYLDGATGGVGIGTSTPTGKLHVLGSAAGSPALVVQGASSQTANLLQLQNSSSVVMARFTADGALAINNSSIGAQSKFAVNPNLVTDTLAVAQINTVNTSDKGLVIQGVTSQTGDLLQIQNNAGGVLAAFDSNGNLKLNYVLDRASTGATLLMNPAGTNSGAVTIGTRTTTNNGLIVQGVSGQTANLQEWQGSSNNRLLSVSAEGAIVGNGGLTFYGDSDDPEAIAVFASDYGIALFNASIVAKSQADIVPAGILQGAVGQTADLLQLMDSDETVLAAFDASGHLRIGLAAASTGVVRLENGTAIYARNAANDGDIYLIGTDASDNVSIASSGQQTNVGGGLTVAGSLTTGSPIAVTSGGTGAGSFTQYGLLFGNGTGALQSVPVGSSGQCLTGNTGNAPTWGTCTPGGTGDIKQGGNDFGGTTGMTLGTINNGDVNILTNNVPTFRLANTGAATFQNASDSATAFQIQNAAGTSLFNIDSTNSRIYIGNATPDGVGTLLVLDNKNTSGDPTGVDGGMYYNSATGKFRCYEGSEWKDCITNVRSAAKPSDQTFSSTSYSDVNGLSFNVLANQSYRLQCTLLLSVPVGTNGGNISTLGPGAPGQYTATFAKAVESSGDNYATSSTYDDTSAATSFRVNTISTGSNRFIISYNAILNNGGSAGAWQLRAKAADGSSSITFYANSSCDLKPL